VLSKYYISILLFYNFVYFIARPRLVTVHKKFDRREQRRELKSLVAAKLDTQILQELQDRFDQVTEKIIYIYIYIFKDLYKLCLREYMTNLST
jgi:hypothetical protein